jgi:signal transduction histidine kinase
VPGLAGVVTGLAAFWGGVQSLSHQLHSSNLDYLGVVTAIRSLCHEVSKQNAVSIEFTDKNVPRQLPKDISLCLFRVVQEGLHNAAKYSGVEPVCSGINCYGGRDSACGE